MATCVAYFTRQGNTKIVAKAVAQDLKADLIELNEDKKYGGLVGFMRGGARAASGKLANVANDVYRQIEKYDTVVLATPVWAGRTTPVINAVLENVDFSGKRVYAITLQADPNGGGHDARMAFYDEKITGRGGVFKGGFALAGTTPGKGARPAAELEAQVKEKVKIK